MTLTVFSLVLGQSLLSQQVEDMEHSGPQLEWWEEIDSGKFPFHLISPTSGRLLAFPRILYGRDRDRW